MKTRTIKTICVAIVTLLVSSCTQGVGNKKNYWAMNSEPDSISTTVKKGNNAILELLSKLGKKKTSNSPEELVSEITVRHQRAPVMIEKIAHEHGVKMGITSSRLRNPENAPPFWASHHVNRPPAKDWKKDTMIFNLEKSVGLLKPLAAHQACLKCHGNVELFSAQLKNELQRLFPGDEAVGYLDGELIGYIWVEAPKEPI